MVKICILVYTVYFLLSVGFETIRSASTRRFYQPYQWYLFSSGVLVVPLANLWL